MYWRDYYKMGEDKRNIKDLKAYLCVGGNTDVARVLQQMPKAKSFLESLNVDVTFQTFSSEGHVLTKSNFDSFWKMIESLN